MPKLPFKILGIEHVGIAVESLEGLYNIFSDNLGLDFIISEEVKDQQVITDIYDTGSGKLEFLKETDKNSPIGHYIEKKGEGIHHIALAVDNIQSALVYLKDKGIHVIDEKPRIGAEGLAIAFLHPKSTCGILVELCEKRLK